MGNKKKLIVTQKEKIKVYYLSGHSVSEVAQKLSLSPSGVMYHLRQKRVLMRSRSDAVTLKHNKKLNSHSSSIPKTISKEHMRLYFVSLALYWGEGSKTGNTVAITNSDPEL